MESVKWFDFGHHCRFIPVRMTWDRSACPTQPYRSVSIPSLWDCCTAQTKCQEYGSRVPSIWVHQHRVQQLPLRSSRQIDWKNAIKILLPLPALKYSIYLQTFAINKHLVHILAFCRIDCLNFLGHTVFALAQFEYMLSTIDDFEDPVW